MSDDRPATFRFGVWRLERGSVRSQLALHGYDFDEVKSFGSSTFIVRGPVDRLRALKQRLEEYT